MNGAGLITTIPGRDFRFAKAPLASKFAPGEFVIFSAIVWRRDIARRGVLLRLLFLIFADATPTINKSRVLKVMDRVMPIAAIEARVDELWKAAAG